MFWNFHAISTQKSAIYSITDATSSKLTLHQRLRGFPLRGLGASCASAVARVVSKPDWELPPGLSKTHWATSAPLRRTGSLKIWCLYVWMYTMYMYISRYIYIYIHIYLYIYLYIYIFMCICICICTSKYMCMCMYIYIYIYTYIYMYTGICVCTYVYIYTHAHTWCAFMCMYVYVYIYIYVHTLCMYNIYITRVCYMHTYIPIYVCMSMGGLKGHLTRNHVFNTALPQV